MADGIQVMQNLLGAFRLGIAAEQGCVSQVEVSVEVEKHLLIGKRLTPVGHLGRASHVLLLHVLKPLPAPERQQQVLLLGSRLQHAAVSQDDGLVFV